MIRRLVLALLPLAGFALGVALTALAAPVPAAALVGGWLLAAAVVGCAVLALTAAALAAPPSAARATGRRPAIPRSSRPGAAARQDPPTLSGYWRADEPDWPEGEVRREREREEEPAATDR